MENPATYHPKIMQAIALLAEQHFPPHSALLDPFAGQGAIFHILPQYNWTGVEIEVLWAASHPKIEVGDALALHYPPETFDGVCTSPCYGNRMADHHEAKDTSRRITYRHCLGQPLHPHNSGNLQWGPAYQAFHLQAWYEVYRVMKPGGVMILNMKDHVRKGQVQRVTEWHQMTLQKIGFTLLEEERIYLKGNGFGSNGKCRVPFETLTVFRRENHEQRVFTTFGDRHQGRSETHPGDGKRVLP